MNRERAHRTGARQALAEQVGAEVMRFQEASNAVDTAAAAVLSIDRRDLPCLTVLMVAGPSGVQRLAGALGVAALAARDMVARLELAGYVRRRTGRDAPQFELTEHARRWIAEIWEPLRERGPAMLANRSARDLELIRDVLRDASAIQEQHAVELRRLMDQPGASRRSRSRGGLSPASLRRVQLFVEANLHTRLRSAALATRAGLSASHFARAFRTSMAMTPRAFIEQQRIARARTLVEEGRLSLADVAAATGFTSQSRFTTTFRRHVGVTPAVVRRSREPIVPSGPVRER